MKLSVLTKKARKVTGEDDPDIRIVNEEGFVDIEILSRNDYYDETYSGKEVEKGIFVCLEPAIA